jgi:hypothetical protein
MKINKVRVAVAVLVVAFIFSILTLVFWTFVRDTIVIPVYYLIWVGGLVINSIPQGIFAGLLAIIGLVIAFNTLTSLPRRSTALAPAKPSTQVDTRYQHWRRLSENLYVSRFSRNLFMADARRLILSILAYENGIEVAEVTALLKAGALELPGGVGTLFAQADHQDELQEVLPSEPFTQKMRRWLRLGNAAPARNPQLEALVADIMGFIEYHLEKAYAGNQPEP